MLLKFDLTNLPFLLQNAKRFLTPKGYLMFKKSLLCTLAFICCFASSVFAEGGITRLTASSFNLRDPGFYSVNFQVPVVEPGQLQLRLNGTPLESSTVGRDTGNTQLVGFNIIETTVANTVLELINPASNTAINIAPGTAENPLSAHIVVLRLR